MGQMDLDRSYFEGRETITTSGNLVRHEMIFTGYYEIGDTIDVLDIGVNGCIISVLGTATVVAIEKDTALILSSAIDTSLATGTAYAQVRDIDDGQEAIDRLYKKSSSVGSCEILQPILAQRLNDPAVGQASYDVADIGYFKAGDSVTILHDAGSAGAATILSVNTAADEDNYKSYIVIDSAIDTSALTNPKFQNVVPVCVLIDRLKQDIDAIDEPTENELMDIPDCSNTVFAADSLFKERSSKVFIDGNRKRLGTDGTRAELAVGTYPGNDDALKYTSLVLGTAGNLTEVSVTAGAGTVVTVSGDWQTGYTIDVTDNTGAATAAEIAAAINADSAAQRIVQAQFGGDGSGVVAPFVATALAGGLNDGTGDYAELPQIINNEVSLTGYKWISFWILPADRNRMNKPPRNTEELVIDYRQILYNA